MAEKARVLPQEELSPVTWSMIQVARNLIKSHLVRTPLVYDEHLSCRTGGSVWHKLESLQVTGSFKVRGALVKVLTSPPEKRMGGLVCASTGNHGRGLAYVAQKLGIRAWIVVPERTPANKIEAIRELNASVVIWGRDYGEAEEKAFALAKERGFLFCPSFDDRWVVAAHASVLWEILEDCPDADLLVVPVGGGALLAGCLLVRDRLKPSLGVVAVEAIGSPALTSALECGEPERVREVTTSADGIAVPQIGRTPFEVIAHRLAGPVIKVSDEEMEEGMAHLIGRVRVVAEHAGAAAVGALLTGRIEGTEGRTVITVVTGGNIGWNRLLSVLSKRIGDGS